MCGCIDRHACVAHADGTADAAYLLLPAPQGIHYSTGLCKLSDVEKNYRIGPQTAGREQGCRIEIKPGRVEVVAHDATGAFYARKTLEQLALQTDRKGYVRCLEIADVPGRGGEAEAYMDKSEIEMPQSMEILCRNSFDGEGIPDHALRMSCTAPWHAGFALADYINALGNR